MAIVLPCAISPELFGVQLVVINLITRSDRRLNSGTNRVRSTCNCDSSLTVGAASFGSRVVAVIQTKIAGLMSSQQDQCGIAFFTGCRDSQIRSNFRQALLLIKRSSCPNTWLRISTHVKHCYKWGRWQTHCISPCAKSTMGLGTRGQVLT